jgi:hypothetical protein
MGALVTSAEEILREDHGAAAVRLKNPPTLARAAYRRALMIRTINQQMADVRDAAWETAERAQVPPTLAADVRTLLDANPTWSWDAAIAARAAAQ